MKKEEYIKRRGGVMYEKMLQQSRDWNAQWRKANPDKAKAHHQERGHKGGKYYEKMLIYNKTGIPGERHKIRMKHWGLYRAIKETTPNTQIHHEWIPGTAKYRGVALVDKEAHRNGIIKVIKVLEGEITIFTEKEIRKVETK